MPRTASEVTPGNEADNQPSLFVDSLFESQRYRSYLSFFSFSIIGRLPQADSFLLVETGATSSSKLSNFLGELSKTNCSCSVRRPHRSSRLIQPLGIQRARSVEATCREDWQPRMVTNGGAQARRQKEVLLTAHCGKDTEDHSDKRGDTQRRRQTGARELSFPLSDCHIASSLKAFLRLQAPLIKAADDAVVSATLSIRPLALSLTSVAFVCTSLIPTEGCSRSDSRNNSFFPFAPSGEDISCQVFAMV